MPTTDGWKELAPPDSHKLPPPYTDVDKTPPFDLVDAAGNASHAFVANLTGDGYPGVIASTRLADGSITAFAFTQDTTRWHDAHSSFLTSAILATSDPKLPPVDAYVGPLVGKGGDNIVLLNDLRIFAGDSVEQRNSKFGRIFTNDGTKFTEQAEFAPPVVFAKQDWGVRFIDLHGTGLPDIIYSHVISGGGKTKLVSGAYRNTGRGWIKELNWTPFVGPRVVGFKV